MLTNYKMSVFSLITVMKEVQRYNDGGAHVQLSTFSKLLCSRIAYNAVS